MFETIPATVDRLASRYAETPRPGEIHRARRQFDALRGQVYDDDELYTVHMALFLEWFALERPLERGLAPVGLALALARPGEEGAADAEADDPAEAELLLALARSQRGLFRVEAVEPGGLRLRDLVLGGRWAPRLERPLGGVEPGDLLEGRLIPWQGQVSLGPTLFFHPRAAAVAVAALLEAAGAPGLRDPALVHRLAEMRLRYSRFRNIAVQHIYKVGGLGQGDGGAGPRDR